MQSEWHRHHHDAVNHLQPHRATHTLEGGAGSCETTEHMCGHVIIMCSSPSHPPCHEQEVLSRFFHKNVFVACQSKCSCCELNQLLCQNKLIYVETRICCYGSFKVEQEVDPFTPLMAQVCLTLPRLRAKVRHTTSCFKTIICSLPFVRKTF